MKRLVPSFLRWVIVLFFGKLPIIQLPLHAQTLIGCCLTVWLFIIIEETSTAVTLDSIRCDWEQHFKTILAIAGSHFQNPFSWIQATILRQKEKVTLAVCISNTTRFETLAARDRRQ